MKKLFCLGLGYSAQWLGRQVLEQGWEVSGTLNNKDNIPNATELGFRAYKWNNNTRLSSKALNDLKEATHIIVSIPPNENGETVVRNFWSELASSNLLEWVGYLSSTGVYGNHNGGWVDESSPLKPRLQKTKNRIFAERAWLSLFTKYGIPVHVFRLSGIYGPERNVLKALIEGRAQRVRKENHVFSRIHVDDITNTLMASIKKPHPGSIYNVGDDEPAAHEDVVAYGSKLLGTTPPPLVTFENAKISPLAKSFYIESRRVNNARIKSELNIKLKYPNYREGLDALVRDFSVKSPKTFRN